MIRPIIAKVASMVCAEAQKVSDNTDVELQKIATEKAAIEDFLKVSMFAEQQQEDAARHQNDLFKVAGWAKLDPDSLLAAVGQDDGLAVLVKEALDANILKLE